MATLFCSKARQDGNATQVVGSSDRSMFCQQEAAFTPPTLTNTTEMFQACGIRIIFICLYDFDMSLPSQSQLLFGIIMWILQFAKIALYSLRELGELHPLSSGIQPRQHTAVCHSRQTVRETCLFLSKLWFPWRVWQQDAEAAPWSIPGLETAWQASISAELLEVDACVQVQAQKECGEWATGSASKPRNAVRAVGPIPASLTCRGEGADSLARRERGAASLLLEGVLCHRCCRCGGFRGKILWPAHCNSPCEAAEVPCLQRTLDWPQNDAEQDDDQRREEDYAFPVIAHVAAGQPPS